MNKLYILCGIPFSGKSWLADQLVEKLGAIKIDLDDVKFELFGKDITDAEIEQSGWAKVYQEMYKRIEKALKLGKSVIHDTGNFTKYERGLVRKIADELALRTITIFVNTPVEVAKERLLKNRETKDRFDVTDKNFQDSVAEMEPPGEEENSIEYKPTDSFEDLVAKLGN